MDSTYSEFFSKWDAKVEAMKNGNCSTPSLPTTEMGNDGGSTTHCQNETRRDELPHLRLQLIAREEELETTRKCLFERMEELEMVRKDLQERDRELGRAKNQLRDKDAEAQRQKSVMEGELLRMTAENQRMERELKDSKSQNETLKLEKSETVTSMNDMLNSFKVIAEVEHNRLKGELAKVNQLVQKLKGDWEVQKMEWAQKLNGMEQRLRNKNKLVKQLGKVVAERVKLITDDLVSGDSDEDGDDDVDGVGAPNQNTASLSPRAPITNPKPILNHDVGGIDDDQPEMETGYQQPSPHRRASVRRASRLNNSPGVSGGSSVEFFGTEHGEHVDPENPQLVSCICGRVLKNRTGLTHHLKYAKMKSSKQFDQCRTQEEHLMRQVPYLPKEQDMEREPPTKRPRSVMEEINEDGNGKEHNVEPSEMPVLLGDMEVVVKDEVTMTHMSPSSSPSYF